MLDLPVSWSPVQDPRLHSSDLAIVCYETEASWKWEELYRVMSVQPFFFFFILSNRTKVTACNKL